MQIWKFNLDHDVHQNVVMPRGAVLLDLQNHMGQLALWACVDPEAEKIQRDLSIVSTGHGIPGGQQAYIATTQQGSLVWHLFDGGEF